MQYVMPELNPFVRHSKMSEALGNFALSERLIPLMPTLKKSKLDVRLPRLQTHNFLRHSNKLKEIDSPLGQQRRDVNSKPLLVPVKKLGNGSRFLTALSTVRMMTSLALDMDALGDKDLDTETVASKKELQLKNTMRFFPTVKKLISSISITSRSLSNTPLISPWRAYQKRMLDSRLLLTLDKLRLRLKLRLPGQLLRLLSPKDLLILLHPLMQLSPDSLLSF